MKDTYSRGCFSIWDCFEQLACFRNGIYKIQNKSLDAQQKRIGPVFINWHMKIILRWACDGKE